MEMHFVSNDDIISKKLTGAENTIRYSYSSAK